MESQDFRIGNFVYGIDEHYKETYMEISSLHNDNTFRLKIGKDSVGCYSVHWIKPIELTNELLISFGFKQTTLRKGVLFYELNGIRIDNPFDFFFSLGVKFKNNRCVNIKYVHQLQNLFWCLTGEELTIK